MDVPYGAERSKEGKAREAQLGVLPRQRNVCRTLNGAQRKTVAMPIPGTQTRGMQKLQ